MEGKFLELAKKANAIQWDYDLLEFVPSYEIDHLTKFGELVAKECASIVCAIENGNSQEGTEHPSLAIFKRFDIQ